MNNLNRENIDDRVLDDVNIFDLLKLQEMGLSDEELASELKISKNKLSKLLCEYDVKIQGD